MKTPHLNWSGLYPGLAGPASSPFRLFLLVAAILVPVSCCSNGKVWDRSREEIYPRILHGDTEFLRHIDYSQGRLEDAEKLAPGGTLNMAVLLGEMGLSGMEGRMLEASAEHSPEPWASAAGVLLRRHLREQGKYRRLEKEAEKARQDSPGDWHVLRDLTAARYYQGKNRAALKDLRTWEAVEQDLLAGGALGEGLSRESLRYWQGERRLWRPVLLHRLGRDGWREGFVSFFARGAAPGVLHRGWDYLEGQNLLDTLSDPERRLVEGRYRLSRGEPEEAWLLLREALEAQAGWRLYPEMQRAFRKAALGAGRGAVLQGAELLAEWAPRIYGRAGGEAWENCGRLYRKAGAWSLGAEAFLRAYEAQPALKQGEAWMGGTVSEGDVRLWFYLDCAVQARPRAAPELMGRYARHWEDPEWYADLVSRLASEMAAGGRWEDLWLLYQGVEDYASPRAKDQLETVLFRAVEEGFLPVSEGSREALRKGWRDGIIFRDRGIGAGPGYYFYLMAAWTGLEDPGRLLGLHREDEGLDLKPEAQGHPWAAPEVVQGFLDWGLTDPVLDMVQEDRVRDPDILRRLSDQLAEKGDYYHSIRTAVRLFYREDTLPSREDWLRLYPRPYQSEVESLCRETGVSPWMVYGLLRRESLFHPGIKSHAGAVGLAQIMPATGQWLAGKFSLGGDLDLTDPGTSLYLGIYYLRDLLRRFDSPVKALMAYNAGATRVRRWEGKFRNLPAVLMTEAVPYEETRGYVRAVLASAVIYGYLYGDQGAAETVELFYPRAE